MIGKGCDDDFALNLGRKTLCNDDAHVSNSRGSGNR